MSRAPKVFPKVLAILVINLAEHQLYEISSSSTKEITSDAIGFGVSDREANVAQYE